MWFDKIFLWRLNEIVNDGLEWWKISKGIFEINWLRWNVDFEKWIR